MSPSGDVDYELFPDAAKEDDTFNKALAGDLGPEREEDATYVSNWRARDPVALKKNIMKYVLASGAGKQVFQDNFDAVDAQADEVATKAGGFSTDAKFKKQLKDNLMLEMLWNTYYGNEDWIPIAAQQGNKGARMLVGANRGAGTP